MLSFLPNPSFSILRSQIASWYQSFILALFILLIPSQTAFHAWPRWTVSEQQKIDYLAPTLYITDLLIILIVTPGILHRNKNNHFFQNPSPGFLFVSGLVVANVLFSINPYVSIIKFLRLGLYGSLILHLKKHSTFFTHLFPDLLRWSLVWVCLLTWGQFISQSHLGGIWTWLGERPLSVYSFKVAKMDLGNMGVYLRPYSTFSHPNSLAGFLGLSVLLLLLTNKSENLLPVLVLASSALILTFSRTALLAFVFSLILHLYNQANTNKAFLFLMSFLLAVGILGLSGNRLLDSPQFLQRTSLNMQSFKLAVNNLLFGIGLGTYPVVSVYNHQPVHNTYMLILSELGMLFAMFLAKVSYQPIRFVLSDRSLMPSIVFIMLTSFFDHYWLTLAQNLLLLSVTISFIYLRSDSENV